jgi:hypothetical protein
MNEEGPKWVKSGDLTWQLQNSVNECMLLATFHGKILLCTFVGASH